MSNTNQTAHRHHFIPKFYLKSWKGSDGKGLWVYTLDKRNVVRTYRRSPKSVGFADDLYTLLPDSSYQVLNHERDAIETKFFAVLDNAAAGIHDKLLKSGVRNLTNEDRMLWSLFLNSLIERSPNQIKQIEQCDSVENMQDRLIQKFGNSEFLSTIDLDALYQNSARYALVDIIKDNAFTRYLTEMRWAVVDITIDGEHLVTSDTPLILNGGARGTPIHCVSIAISPKRLLIIYSKADEFDDDFVRTLSVMHNILVIRQKERYLISSQKLLDGPHTKYSCFLTELIKGVDSEESS